MNGKQGSTEDLLLALGGGVSLLLADLRDRLEVELVTGAEDASARARAEHRHAEVVAVLQVLDRHSQAASSAPAAVGPLPASGEAYHD